jgi:uncharacterized membrane protein
MSKDGERPPLEGSSVHPTATLLREHLARIERLLQVEDAEFEKRIENAALPAWLRETCGEHRIPVTLCVLVATILQILVPHRYQPTPHVLFPVLALLLLAALVVANPHRIDRESRALRIGGLSLSLAVTIANIWSGTLLISGILRGTVPQDTTMLWVGAAIWCTNVIVFALWYWEFDRGGPVARAQGGNAHPDLLFTQMQSPELAASGWEPTFLDYLYLSFTNATAFSPTDTLPLTRWAKMAMMTQAIVSLVTVALVIARAVNVLQ